MTITFESLPRPDGSHSVCMRVGDETTTVAISAGEWEKLQRAAKMLVFYVHPANHDDNEERKKASEDAVRDAYIAFALSNPHYRRTELAEKNGIHAPDGMVFHTELFTSGYQGRNFFHPIMQMSMAALAKPTLPDDAPLSAVALLADMKRATAPKPLVSDVKNEPIVAASPGEGRV